MNSKMLLLSLLYIFCSFHFGETLLKPTNEHNSVATLYNMVKRLNETVLSMENIIRQQNDTINGLSLNNGNSGTQTIAFYAKLSKEIPILGDNQVIAFETVMTNLGNAYDAQHGTFTAPVKGLYSLSASVMSPTGANLYCRMLRNGHVLTRFYGAYLDHHSDTQTIVVVLQAGDKVLIVHSPGSVNDGIHGFNSYFSGFLITQTV